jgi:hypothetical protein
MTTVLTVKNQQFQVYLTFLIYANIARNVHSPPPYIEYSNKQIALKLEPKLEIGEVNNGGLEDLYQHSGTVS